LVVSNPELARQLLTEKGLTAALREIVVVEMNDQPGGLDDLLKEIVRSNVNFTNAYGRSEFSSGKAYFVIDTEDIADARKKFQDAGLALLSDEKIYGIDKL